MQNHIGCICSTFPHCVFSNVSSNCLPERMQSHIGCICSTFLHCAFSNVSCVLSMSNWNHEDCKSEEMTNESESMEHLQVLSPQISNHNPPEISFFSPHQNLCSSPSKSIYPFKFNFFPILGFGGTTHPLLGKSPENLGSKNLWGIKTSRNGQIWPPHFMWYMFQDITGCLQYN